MSRRLAAVVATALVLAAAGAAAGVGGGDRGGPSAPSAARPGRDGAAQPAAPVPPTSAATAPVAGAPVVVMVRHAGGVPDSWRRRLRRLRGVGTVTAVARTQALLRRTTAAGGGRSRAVRPGYVVVLDTLVVEPRRYAAMLPAADARLVRRLRPGTALLSRRSARLRRAGRGSTLTLAGGRRLRIAGVLDDPPALATELVVAVSEGRRLGAPQGFLVAAVDGEPAVRRVARTFDEPRTAVAQLGRAPWPVRRRIASAAELKDRFGEFALRLPVGGDWVQPDPAWVARNIVTRRVPILGPVHCNRRIFPALRSAMAELIRRRLTRLVDPGDYAGCYAARRIPGSGSLSLHAWGLAVDLNASRNPQGSPPHQDRRLVTIMERHGFSWGGRWPTVPDGMHFEFHGDGPPVLDAP
jgi:hypothetical protein